MNKITQLASQCRVASTYDKVYKSECVFSFHNPYTSPLGIVVNLHTFIGTVDALAFAAQRRHGRNEKDDNHDDSSQQQQEEAIFLRIVMNRIPKAKQQDANEKQGGETVVTKLGLGVEGGFTYQ
jgi:hypothetical protein